MGLPGSLSVWLHFCVRHETGGVGDLGGLGGRCRLEGGGQGQGGGGSHHADAGRQSLGERRLMSTPLACGPAASACPSARHGTSASPARRAGMEEGVVTHKLSIGTAGPGLELSDSGPTGDRVVGVDGAGATRPGANGQGDEALTGGLPPTMLPVIGSSTKRPAG